MGERQHIWHVEGSLPPEEGKTWRRNLNVTVMALDLPAVVEAVTVEYPGIELHKVMRDREGHALIVVGHPEQREGSGEGK